MVKPPLRTKSIGFKVSEEEYAQLETAAQAGGRTLGEWCREAILREMSDAERHDPALAEIVGVRLLLVNVLRPVAAGERLAPEAFDKMLDQISEVKHELAAKLQQQAARKNPEPRKPSGDVWSRPTNRAAAKTIQMWHRWAIRIVCGFLFVALAGLGTTCYSQTCGSARAELQPTPGIYIPPNEQHPAAALLIYRKSNHGVYVSVGTERSFIGAALTRAEALFVIDYDPETIRFANINRALLAVSSDRVDYVNLRLNTTREVWQQRSRQLSGDDSETLASPNSWIFWDKKVRKNELAWDNAFGHFHTEPKHPNDPFFASDYLYDDGLYRHLSRLAKGSRIWARVVDLRHENEVRGLCDEIKAKGLTLGVIDTSDVPNAADASTSVTAQYIKLFSPYAKDNTLFLNTAPAGGRGVRWSYYAFSNGKIRGHDQNTIKRWYEIEMKKIGASDQTGALLDDPDAINH
jgi:hypothetical protein